MVFQGFSYPSSGDLGFLSFFCLVAPVSPATLESCIRGFASWQVKREGGNMDLSGESRGQA